MERDLSKERWIRDRFSNMGDEAGRLEVGGKFRDRSYSGVSEEMVELSAALVQLSLVMDTHVCPFPSPLHNAYRQVQSHYIIFH